MLDCESASLLSLHAVRENPADGYLCPCGASHIMLGTGRGASPRGVVKPRVVAAPDALHRSEARRLRVPRIDHLADVPGVEVERVEGQRLLGLEEADLHLPVLGAKLREVVLQPRDAQV